MGPGGQRGSHGGRLLVSSLLEQQQAGGNDCWLATTEAPRPHFVGSASCGTRMAAGGCRGAGIVWFWCGCEERTLPAWAGLNSGVAELACAASERTCGPICSGPHPNDSFFLLEGKVAGVVENFLEGSSRELFLEAKLARFLKSLCFLEGYLKKLNTGDFFNKNRS